MTRGVPSGSLHPWTTAEEKLLLEGYRSGNVESLPEKLGRTRDAIRTRYRRLASQRSREAETLKNEESRPDTNGRRWTREEQEFLEGTLDEPVAEVAAAIDRSIFATQQRRHRTLAGELFEFGDDGGHVGVAVQSVAPTCSRCFCQHNGDC